MLQRCVINLLLPICSQTVNCIGGKKVRIVKQVAAERVRPQRG